MKITKISEKKLAKYKLCGRVNSTATGKLLYLMLDEIVDRNNEIIVPQRKISETLRVPKSTVSRNLRRLRDDGYIEIRARYRDEGGRDANKYVMK